LSQRISGTATPACLFVVQMAITPQQKLQNWRPAMQNNTQNQNNGMNQPKKSDDLKKDQNKNPNDKSAKGSCGC
jgi:hypothetical protein